MSSPNFPKQVTIGYTGEHAARAIEFDCSEEFEKWPDSEPRVMYVRPTEDRSISMYPGSTSRDGDIVYWTPDAFATEIEGTDGYCQVFFYGNIETESESNNSEEEESEEFIDPQYLGKSALVRVTVEPALMAPESDPVLESVEYVSLYRRMQVAARILERISVSATDGDEADAQVSSDNSGFQINFVLPRGRSFTFSDFTSDELNLLRGEPGPEGPEGPEGPQGPQGPAGTIEFSNLTDAQLDAFLERVGWLTDSEIDDIFESESLTPATPVSN